MVEVVVVIGSGGIGLAIAKRQGPGRTVLIDGGVIAAMRAGKLPVPGDAA
jgi:hypothetical protein